MSQSNIMLLFTGFLLGVLVAAAGVGTALHGRLGVERERADRAEGEAEQQRDRADQLELELQLIRLDAEQRQTEIVPRDRAAERRAEAAKEETMKRARQAFWEAVERERQKQRPSAVPVQ
jgi:hypothetical protein